MRLSIVDLATVAPGTTEADALNDALDTARHADATGFHRIWFAEHHATTAHASHNPELLVAMAGAHTSGIRVGSGGVLLNHYSPFKVAESFKQLEAMLPGRVDLGMGRATSGPHIDLALRPDRSTRPTDDHAERVQEVLAWLHGAFPDDHPFAPYRVMESVKDMPQTWLLGSSPGGAALAGPLGIGYTFAGFINPAAAAAALRDYRHRFRPTGLGPSEPRAILAVNVAVGDDDADGQRLAASAKGYYARLRHHAATATVPTPDEALRELTEAQRDEPTTITEGAWPRFVAGGPARVRETLERMAAESGADELMIQNLISDPPARRASHERLANMFTLRPRPTP